MKRGRPWWTMKISATPFKRARGMLWNAEPGRIMVFAPCRDIHTFGMRNNLDVAFVDDEGVVVEAKRCLAPRNRMRNKEACMVLERVASAAPWYREGDHVILSLRRGGNQIQIATS